MSTTVSFRSAASLPNGLVRCGQKRFAMFVGIVTILLTGCTAQLAPPFNQMILDHLVKANTDALVIYAAVGGGTTATTFSRRVDDYNKVIGEFDAVRSEAKTRENPNPKVPAPTEEAAAHIVDTLKATRDMDKAAGLTPERVEGLKRSYEISLDQALTYEQALKR